ncbi:MAG TPA: ATP-binding protein [Vicinamibacterales bacterium]
MTLLASLTNRIFIAAALLAIVTTGLAVYVVGVRASREAEVQLARGLAEAGALVEEQRQTLTNQSLLVARLLADLPKLKGAVETGDPQTVAPIAADYQRQVGADLLVISGRSGDLLAAGPAGGARPAREAVLQALGGREVIEFRPDPAGVLQMTTIPIVIGLDVPEMLGTLTVGLRLDAARAERFKGATRSEIAFVLGGAIRAATLPRDAWSALEPLLRAPHIAHATVDGAELVGRTQPFAPREGESGPLVLSDTPQVLVLQSRTERLEFLRTVYAALGLAAVAAVLLATVLSYAVARTITRPLATVTAAMREVAATGDLTRKIPMRPPSPWQDEDARLLATTFNTLTDSIARFQREAAQKDRLLSLGRLSTVIAHEVRNPLMIIKAALRSLRPDAPAAEIREAVRDIDEEVNRLNRIVHDVLDFARPPAMASEPVDLVRLCHDAAAAASVDGGPPIALALPPGPLVVATDPERLRTALVNVLANARQAVEARRRAGEDPAAGGEPPVQLALERAGEAQIRLRVVDRGTGIRPEDLPQIFEPYFTTRRTGTGLGLAIARNIVEGLGGTIAVETEPGRTALEILLPAGDEPEAPAAIDAAAGGPHRAPAAAETAASPSGPGRRVSV